MNAKIRLANVSKHFGEEGQRSSVLTDVNLSLANGEFTTLVGPSGCGKSTLFNILVGLLAPDPGGELFIDGTQIDYHESMMGSGFAFSNPNAKGTCGCGTSFTA